MSMQISRSVEDLRQRGTIRDADVTRLRAAYKSSDAVTREDAEALIALHAACHIQDPSWSTFLVETLTDYLVNQLEPEGYVVSANGRWLIEQIARFGRVETSTELALLIHVVDTARWTPPSLVTFALDQIRQAIVTGTGPLRAGRSIEPGAIVIQDVDLAARIIASFGGGSALPITRAEADTFININRALLPGQSSPAWSDLFVRTVGSAVLSALGHAVAPRNELRTATLANRRPTQLLSLLIGDSEAHEASHQRGTDRGKGGAGLSIWSTAPIMTPEERALVRLARQRLEIVTNEVIEEATDVWLLTRLAEASELNANEAGLLTYIVQEASLLSPALSELATRMRAAA